MKILHIITLSEIGGAQSVVTTLSNRFCEKGNTMAVLSSNGGLMWEMLDERIIQYHCGSLVREISLIKDLKTFFYIRKIINSFMPEIIHLHSSKIGVLGRLAAFPKFSNKTVYTVHGFDTILKANKIFLPIEKLLKRITREIIAVSKYDYKRLAENNISSEVIYNGTNMVKDEERRIDTQRKSIVCVARLAPPKRFDIFLSTAKLLPDYDFFWIGNKNSCHERLPDNVHLLGEVKRAAEKLATFSLFMLPSDYEGLPISIIEAISVGLPTVASDVGGVSELLEENCGIAVPNDPQLFSAAIVKILEDDFTYLEMKKACYKKFEHSLSVENMVGGYERIYSKCIKQ